MAAINLDIGGNTSRLDRDIQKTVNKVYNINLKTKGDQPLGRITGKLNEFNKSLEASNARVIAFGASAGIIFGLQRAFSSLVTSTIEVQKSLQDINVILNVSSAQLNKFGSELFNIAKNTGQSFQQVANAATEFSRQGLGVVETLKRTNEALILSRLSGLDAAKSVEALTAAVNSFASQAVTATEIVNKFATVDAAFAVSSADLADAIARVGSSAAQSGVSLNELIALVTSAQQTTARGGAVIGNSFKTIFTRLQREKVVDLLGSLGISGTNASGEVKSTIQLLTELGQVYDTLGSQQQAFVAEQVGGVFQINILKAALADLGKEYSIYGSALSTAESSTDKAIKRNEELNKTYAAQLNALQQNAKQLAAGVGTRVLGPAFDRVVGGANEILGGINESDGKGVGSVLGKGILDGLGQIIAGPGLVLVGGVILKLAKDFSSFAVGSAKSLLGLNTAAEQQKNIQQSINQILAKNPQLIELALKGEQGLNQAANTLLQSLRNQTVELQNQEKVAARIAKAFYGAGVRVSGGVPITPAGKPGKAAGYIPNFASQKNKVAETIGAYQANYEPGRIYTERLFDGQGGSFLATVNSAESIDTVVGPNGNKGTFVTPPTVAAKGFVPNFAKTKLPENISLDDAIKRNIYSRSQLSQRFGAKEVNEKLGSAKKTPKDNVFASRLIGSRLPTILTPSEGGRVASKTQKGVGPNGENVVWNFPVRNANRGPLKESIESTFGSGNFIDQWINSNLIGISGQIATAMGVKPAKPGKLSEVKNAKGFKGAISSTLGTIFDSAITTSLDIAAQKDGGDFDIRGGENVRKSIAKLFGENALSKGKSGQWLGDIKISSGPDAVDSMISKTRKEWSNIFTGGAKKKLAFSGYIPNFAALSSAISRERSAGVPSSRIYVAQDSRLAAAGYNPLGLGVFNTRDEPTAGARSAAIKSRGYAGGYIPNFAENQPAAPLGQSIAALIGEFSILAFFLKDIRTDMATAHQNAIEEATNEIAKDKEKLASLEKGTKEHTKLNNEIKKNTASLTKMQKSTTSFGTAFSAASASLLIGAPIIGQTIKNAIGSESRGARTAGAAVEGVTNTISFAALGSQISSVLPKKFRGLGTAIFAATGAILGATGIIKEWGTSLPELEAAAKKSSEELSAFENIAQQAKTAFEQIGDLRSKGQAKEAGAVESKILTDIGKEVKDPNIAAEIQRAFINRDEAGLRAAIDENTKALREKSIKEEKSVAVAGSIQAINAQRGFFGGLSDKGREKQLSEAKNIFTGSLFDLKSKTLQDGKEVRSTGIERFSQLQNLGRLNETGGSEDYLKILEELGFEGEELKVLIQNEKALRPLLQKLINEQIETQASILRNTEEGNSVVKQINDVMRNVKSKYEDFAKAITQGVTNQIAANSEIKNALSRIEVGRLESDAEITEAFTGPTSAATRQAKTSAELAKIDSDFTTAISEPVTQATKTLFEILQSSVSSKIGELTSPGKDQDAAVTNFESLQEKIGPLLESLNLQNLESILTPAGPNFEGYNVKDIIDKLTPQVQGDGALEALKTLEKELNTANMVLDEQRRVQQEQKTLLAQQKFTEIAKLFASAAKESFGGFEGFLKDSFNENNKALEDAASNIRIIGKNPQTREGQIEVGRNLGIVTSELSKLSGLNIGPELAKFAPNIISQIQSGQSQYIEDNLGTVFNSLKGLDEGISKALRESLGKKFGLGENASNKQIADATAEAQTKAQFELLPAITESIKKASIAELGKDSKNADLIKLLESPASAFLDPQSYTNLAIQTSNDYLKQILEAINKSIEDPSVSVTPTPSSESGRGRAGGGGGGTGGAAGGFFPSFANTKESIIPNFWQQYKQEKRDQLKNGYSGGKPVLLGQNNFNPLKDAIANPRQMALFGGMRSKRFNAAGGYFPNFAFVSQERINKLLNMVRNGTPSERRNAIAALKRLEKAGKLPPGVLSGSQVPPTTTPKAGPRLALPGPARRPPKPVPLPQPKAFSKAAKAIPYVGAGITALSAYSDYQENTGKGMDSTEAAVRAALEVGGTALGGLVGLAAGGGIASAATGTFGALGGNLLGQVIGDLIYGVPGDKIDPTANPSTKPPRGRLPKPPKKSKQQLLPKKTEQKKLDRDVQKMMGPNLPSLEERKAIADREIQAQLIRWQMGASAEFKTYDKDYNETGIIDSYGTQGEVAKGSSIDITKRINELRGRLKQSTSFSEGPSRDATARQIMALQNRMRSEILPKSQSKKQIGINPSGAKSLIDRSIAQGTALNNIELKGRNFTGLTRAITNAKGEVVGYSRNNPEAAKKYREYSGAPGVYVDGKLWADPNAEAVDPMNQITDFAKLERTKDKEQIESGVPRSEIYALNLPEVVAPDNPDGTAVFNKEDERSIEEARKAVKRSSVGGGGKFGGGGASASWAGGYFPNFAETNSTSNNINVSVGVNITANASASSIDKDALSAQIKNLLEVEVPKLNALQARVDRMGEVVTKVQEGNPGKYNLPPKQVPK